MKKNAAGCFKTIKLFLPDDSGAAMLFVIVLAVICSLVIGAVSFSSRYTVKKSGVRRVQVSTFNIADAGKEQVLAKLRSREINPQPNETATVYTNEPLGPGMYSVWYRTNATNDSIIIRSTGKCQGDSLQIEVVATMAPDAWSRWVRGALNARTAISMLGNGIIDGRDYDTVGGNFGTLLPGIPGTVGVSAGGAVSINNASAAIGGRGVAPQRPPIPGTTVEEYADTNGYPTTPEAVLGVPAGSLDAYKVTSAPSSSFYGIVYSDQPYYNFAGGIFICHNATGTASLGNYHGHFKGLIIADDVSKFNGGSSVLGAVLLLVNASAGNCDINGTARINYSSRMLAKVLKSLPSPGRRDVDIVSFREIR